MNETTPTNNQDDEWSSLVFRMYKEEYGAKIVLTNFLFGMPLYGYYVFQIDAFEDGDIEGTLMTAPFDISGPFDDFDKANELAQTLYKS